MENISRYKKLNRMNTNRTINEPPNVFAGRTLNECLNSAIVFVSLSIIGYKFIGLLIATIIFVILPKLRQKFPRNIILHFIFACGISQDSESKNFIGKIINKLKFNSKSEFIPIPYFQKNKLCVRVP